MQRQLIAAVTKGGAKRNVKPSADLVKVYSDAKLGHEPIEDVARALLDAGVQEESVRALVAKTVHGTRKSAARADALIRKAAVEDVIAWRGIILGRDEPVCLFKVRTPVPPTFAHVEPAPVEHAAVGTVTVDGERLLSLLEKALTGGVPETTSKTQCNACGMRYEADTLSDVEEWEFQHANECSGGGD